MLRGPVGMRRNDANNMHSVQLCMAFQGADSQNLLNEGTKYNLVAPWTLLCIHSMSFLTSHLEMDMH